MSAGDIARAAAEILLPVWLWVMSFFGVCRQASAWYEKALFRLYVKIPRSVCGIFICHDAERENRGWRKPIWVAPGEDRQKMNLLGLAAYLWFTGFCGYMSYVAVREDILGAVYPEEYWLRLFSWWAASFILFSFFRILNNLRVCR